jgi:hypothetical protein
MIAGESNGIQTIWALGHSGGEGEEEGNELTYWRNRDLNMYSNTVVCMRQL